MTEKLEKSYGTGAWGARVPARTMRRLKPMSLRTAASPVRHGELRTRFSRRLNAPEGFPHIPRRTALTHPVAGPVAIVASTRKPCAREHARATANYMDENTCVRNKVNRNVSKDPDPDTSASVRETLAKN